MILRRIIASAAYHIRRSRRFCLLLSSLGSAKAAPPPATAVRMTTTPSRRSKSMISCPAWFDDNGYHVSRKSWGGGQINDEKRWRVNDFRSSSIIIIIIVVSTPCKHDWRVQLLSVWPAVRSVVCKSLSCFYYYFFIPRQRFYRILFRLLFFYTRYYFFLFTYVFLYIRKHTRATKRQRHWNPDVFAICTIHWYNKRVY